MDNFLKKLLIEKHLWYFQYYKLFEQKEFIDFIREYNQYFGIETTNDAQVSQSRISDLQREIDNCNETIGFRDNRIEELENEIENLKNEIKGCEKTLNLY
jgi:chromosome segregation ATPase